MTRCVRSCLRVTPAVVLALCAGLAAVAARPEPTRAEPPAAPPAARGTAYLAGGLSEDDWTVLGAAVAADPDAVLLIDSPQTVAANRAFLDAFGPKELVAVGKFPQGAEDVGKRLGRAPAAVLEWKNGCSPALLKRLFPKADRVVVTPAQPHGVFLQAAALAGLLRAPLLVVRTEEDAAEARRRLDDWQAKEVFAVGAAAKSLGDAPPGRRVQALTDEAAVAAAFVKELGGKTPPALVVANPADVEHGFGSMSALAPYFAARKRSPLVLTGPRGDDISAVVEATLKEPTLARVDALLLLAGLEAITTERRPNPVPGKDKEIEMEPLTPKDNDVFSFATGRLFHDDPAVVALMLARQRLLEPAKDPKAAKPRKALVVSNPGGGLPLLETFSRHTAHELKNAGYQTTALFRNDVEKEQVRKLVPDQDIFLWEGHYRTLIDDFDFLKWDEPLPPSLIMLQSCLALKEEEAGPLFTRGAVAVVGSSTRTYSATGGAFTIAFFDAMLYDNQTLGGGLRQAKNYLLAYSLLKDKLLGEKAKLSGVNVRSAWAFTLWGDPTLKLPAPPRPEGYLEPIKAEAKASTIFVDLPDTAYEKVAVGKFEATMRPNGRLAGLIKSGPEEEETRELVPFVFAEVALPKPPPGKTPKLTTKLSDKHWVFCWDARRQVGYLLVTPRSKEIRELRFRFEWE